MWTDILFFACVAFVIWGALELLYYWVAGMFK